MNPAVVTGSYVRPQYARRARAIEDRLIKLIDAGEDLALHYHRTQLLNAAKSLRGGHAVVIGDGGFRRRIPIPSLEFDQYSTAKNAVVARFGGVGNDVVIRLLNTAGRRQHPGAPRDRTPRRVEIAPAVVVRRYA